MDSNHGQSEISKFPSGMMKQFQIFLYQEKNFFKEMLVELT